MKSRQSLRISGFPGKHPVSHVFTLIKPEMTPSEEPIVALPGISKFPGTLSFIGDWRWCSGNSMCEKKFPWEGPLLPLTGRVGYSGISHHFLNPEPQPVAPPKAADTKISLETPEDEEILAAEHADLASLVSTILQRDRPPTTL